MKDVEIRKALINRFLTLNTFSGISFITVDSKGKPTNVALPNENFKAPSDNRYFRLSFVPNEPEQIGMYNAGQQRYYGFFQIDICTPKDKGLDEADNKFNWVCKLFIEGTSINGVDVDKVYLATRIEESNVLRTVVRVNFNADIDNNN